MISMDVKRTNIAISLVEGDRTPVSLKWLRGANRYNNGSTLYNGKYQFRYLIGRAKQNQFNNIFNA
jgi:hypothetical protein